MAGDDGRGNSLIPTAAVILILCALTQTLTCFSLHQLSKIVSKDEVSGAMVTEVRTGRILLNGKEFNSKSGMLTTVLLPQEMMDCCILTQNNLMAEVRCSSFLI